jgi:hypothetical protein
MQESFRFATSVALRLAAMRLRTAASGVRR